MMTRRALCSQILRSVPLVGIASGALAWTSGGCTDAESACFDETLLSTPERQLRVAQQYTEPSPLGEERSCAGCQFFESRTDASDCGRCSLLDGPVSRGAHCRGWSPRQRG